MARRLIRIGFTGACIALLALVGSTMGAPAQRAGGSDYVNYTTTLSPLMPDCDGDSVRLTVRASFDDGSAAGSVPVKMSGANGSSIALRKGEPTNFIDALTNSRGVFTAYITPAAGSEARFYYALKVGDNGVGLHLGPCPFAPDRTIVVEASIFDDRDGDGVRDAKERAITHGEFGIGGGCYGPGCFYPINFVRARRDGVFEWTGVVQYPARPGEDPLPNWHFCLSEAEDRRRTLTGINGTPVEWVGQCQYLGPLHEGVNAFEIGVR